VAGDEFRVEVELNDERHGYSLGERLRAVRLDDAARDRLGREVIVTRDGSRLFLYAADERHAREAESVVRALVSAEALSADIGVTRWHPIEEEWRDVSVPLPETEEERRAEYQRREETEAREAAEEGEFDWHVRAALPRREDALELAERLERDGVPVSRRWKYVVARTVTEERAAELAERIEAEAPEGTDVRVEANPADLPRPLLLLFLP
jgi:hypothetical protein